MTKLTYEDLPEIRKLIAAGISDTQIGNQFNVTRQVISGIRRGKSWTGQRNKTGPRARPIEERFWDHVEKGDEDVCWLWNGANRKGTGGPPTLNHEGVAVTAYRIAFEIHYRSLAKDEWVLHTCDNNQCMNPKHLYVGNRYDWTRKWHMVDDWTAGDQEKTQKRTRDYYSRNRDIIKRKSSEYQLERKLAAVQYKGGRCACGEDHPAALQFHHRDPSQKEFSVSSKTLSMPNKIPWQKMRKEIDKCDLLCANCHAKHHSAWSNEMITRKRRTVETYGLANIYEKRV